MAEYNVEVVQLGPITAHPNADRLEIAQVLGTECCIQKGAFKEGDLVLWFPPNVLIPETVADKLGVVNYLKHSLYPGDTVQTHCRVAACRLRGVPSYGFITSITSAQLATVEPTQFDLATAKPGDNVDDYFGATKYTPPVNGQGAPRAKGFNGDAAPDHPNFHRYTDIDNYYKYAKAFEDGLMVRVTEKLHGSNARLGLVKTDDGFEFMCGSNRVNWKPEDSKGNIPLWWRLLTEDIANLLTELCDEQHSVIVFGEVFGPGIQDMDYGVGEDLGFRVFDIAVNGEYLDWSELQIACADHGVETVPCLYVGPFDRAVVTDLTNGPTEMCPADQIKSKFKGREGIVITALEETFSPYFRGRLILKSVSADYHDRKGALDLA